MPTIEIPSSNSHGLQDIANMLLKAKRIVVVTGAGISTNSGIPDFRSENGLYSLIQAQLDGAAKGDAANSTGSSEAQSRKRQRLGDYGPRTSEDGDDNSSTSESRSSSQTNSVVGEEDIVQPLLFTPSQRRVARLNRISMGAQALASSPLSSPPPGIWDSCDDSEKLECEEEDNSQISSSQTLPRSLPNLKGKDLFDAQIWSDPLRTSVFYTFATTLRQKVREARPTPSHHFISHLRDRGKLVRCYTQNIDMIEEKVGLSTELANGPGSRSRFTRRSTLQRAESMIMVNSNAEGQQNCLDEAKNVPSASQPTPTLSRFPSETSLLNDCPPDSQLDHEDEDKSKAALQIRQKSTGVECVYLHGSLESLRCFLCGKSCNWDPVEAETIGGEQPDCPHCTGATEARKERGKRPLGIGKLRPDIVLYGEEHPSSHLISPIITSDLGVAPDMMLIMGTSLRVHGLKVMVREFAKAVHNKGGHVVFINFTKPPESIWGDVIDYWVSWDCDAWVDDLKSHIPLMWVPLGEEDEWKRKQRDAAKAATLEAKAEAKAAEREAKAEAKAVEKEAKAEAKAAEKAAKEESKAAEKAAKEEAKVAERLAKSEAKAAAKGVKLAASIQGAFAKSHEVSSESSEFAASGSQPGNNMPILHLPPLRLKRKYIRRKNSQTAQSEVYSSASSDVPVPASASCALDALQPVVAADSSGDGVDDEGGTAGKVSEKPVSTISVNHAPRARVPLPDEPVLGKSHISYAPRPPPLSEIGGLENRGSKPKSSAGYSKSPKTENEICKRSVEVSKSLSLIAKSKKPRSRKRNAVEGLPVSTTMSSLSNNMTAAQIVASFSIENDMPSAFTKCAASQARSTPSSPHSKMPSMTNTPRRSVLDGFHGFMIDMSFAIRLNSSTGLKALPWTRDPFFIHDGLFGSMNNLWSLNLLRPRLDESPIRLRPPAPATLDTFQYVTPSAERNEDSELLSLKVVSEDSNAQSRGPEEQLALESEADTNIVADTTNVQNKTLVEPKTGPCAKSQELVPITTMRLEADPEPSIERSVCKQPPSVCSQDDGVPLLKVTNTEATNSTICGVSEQNNGETTAIMTLDGPEPVELRKRLPSPLLTRSRAKAKIDGGKELLQSPETPTT
ncbi:NAD-dependent deacetylase hst3 [Ceratocystis pirilliformis]|uniref:NAD-dependent deacetylase hst3 n=1 Tax=Ceratocystis pirilliformis TaxID=259994 RepID=A0ABR3YVW2_9PEZI